MSGEKRLGPESFKLRSWKVVTGTVDMRRFGLWIFRYPQICFHLPPAAPQIRIFLTDRSMLFKIFGNVRTWRVLSGKNLTFHSVIASYIDRRAGLFRIIRPDFISRIESLRYGLDRTHQGRIFSKISNIISRAITEIIADQKFRYFRCSSILTRRNSDSAKSLPVNSQHFSRVIYYSIKILNISILRCFFDYPGTKKEKKGPSGKSLSKLMRCRSATLVWKMLLIGARRIVPVNTCFLSRVSSTWGRRSR